MSAQTQISQLHVLHFLGQKTSGRSEVQSAPIRIRRNMSPRSPLEMDRLGDGKNDDTKQHSLPRAPIKKVSFSTFETSSTHTEHTAATTEETITRNEELEYYGDGEQDDEGHDHDDLDYKDDDEDDHDDDHENDDHVTTTIPTCVAEETTRAISAAKKTKRRKIRWSGQVRVQEIRHLNNMPESEREALWMSPADYKRIKNVAKATVLMMMAGEEIDEDNVNFCSRGLEFRTRRGSKIRSANKLRGRSAVLNEQDLQLEEGFHDPEFIAMASLDVSFECREQAQKRAQKDAQFILTFVKDMSQEVKVTLS